MSESSRVSHFQRKSGIITGKRKVHRSGMLGKKHSEEVRAKMSRAAMGRPKSEEARRNISLANKTKNGITIINQYSSEGVLIATHIGSTEAAKSVNGNPVSIRDYINKRKLGTYKGFLWIKAGKVGAMTI
jgi:hypothetical protein